MQFLKQAVEQVIECRRILKYTYVLGHYLLDNTSEKELYEHHQVGVPSSIVAVAAAH